MLMSYVVLVVSTALFLFYFQTTCEQVLRREFNHSHLKDVISAVQLEYPRLRAALENNAPMDYAEMRLALECDFISLSYLLKSSERSCGRLSVAEKLLKSYFRIQLFSMGLRHALNLRSREAALKSTEILQYFANLTGQRLSVNLLPVDLQS